MGYAEKARPLEEVIRENCKTEREIELVLLGAEIQTNILMANDFGHYSIQHEKIISSATKIKNELKKSKIVTEFGSGAV